MSRRSARLLCNLWLFDRGLQNVDRLSLSALALPPAGDADRTAERRRGVFWGRSGGAAAPLAPAFAAVSVIFAATPSARVPRAYGAGHTRSTGAACANMTGSRVPWNTSACGRAGCATTRHHPDYYSRAAGGSLTQQARAPIRTCAPRRRCAACHALAEFEALLVRPGNSHASLLRTQPSSAPSFPVRRPAVCATQPTVLGPLPLSARRGAARTSCAPGLLRAA
jgi:hypothetical protein